MGGEGEGGFNISKAVSPYITDVRVGGEGEGGFNVSKAVRLT